MSKRVLRWLAAVALYAQQHGAEPEVVKGDPLAGLTVEQREFCLSEARRAVVTGGRRSGKTEAIIARLCRVAVSGGSGLYISLTRKLARRTVWKRIQERLRRLNVAFTKNETHLIIEVAGGGTIEVGGADDREAIERYRGLDYDLVVVDECGAMPSELLRALVTQVLRPGLMDHGGALVLAGTPSRVLAGYWFEQAAPDGMRSSSAPRWEWTIHHNPLFAGRVDTELAAVREENGWTEETITYRVEYLGEWVRDDSVLVYPYSVERNGVAQLPERTPKGYPITGRLWSHVIGVDVGTTPGAMAIVVMCAHPALPHEYVIHAEAHTAMGTDALCQRLRALLVRYPKATIALDSTSIGAPYYLELAGAGLPVLPAKKSDKTVAIRVLHDRVVSGRVKLLMVAALDGLRREWNSLGWDDDHLQHHPDQADHYSDATLYALRQLRHYSSREDMERRPKDPRLEDDDEADEAALERRGVFGIHRTVILLFDQLRPSPMLAAA